jgi:hypothetical protein
MAIAEPAVAPAVRSQPERRAADRRRGILALLAAITPGGSIVKDAAPLRKRFESELRAIVRARAIALRDDPQPAPPNVTCFDLPPGAAHNRARIEAVFDPNRRLDGWTCQTMEAAAWLAALMLEAERAYGRAPLSARARADGAEPLIGSSAAIRAVRERIERVAATDFTVLIEGASGPQPHPDFFEVSAGPPVCDTDRQVAGAGKNGAKMITAQ